MFVATANVALGVLDVEQRGPTPNENNDRLKARIVGRVEPPRNGNGFGDTQRLGDGRPRLGRTHHGRLWGERRRCCLGRLHRVRAGERHQERNPDQPSNRGRRTTHRSTIPRVVQHIQQATGELRRARHGHGRKRRRLRRLQRAGNFQQMIGIFGRLGTRVQHCVITRPLPFESQLSRR